MRWGTGSTVFVVAMALAGIVLGGTAVRPDWRDVAPIFEKRCVNCHSKLGAAKGLRLDSYENAVAGSENGAVLLARNPSGSELVRRLRGESTPRMPFLSTPLPPEEMELILRWIEAGLPDGGASP